VQLGDRKRLVVYDFDPWLNLADYFRDRGSVAVVRGAAKRVGQMLRVLHQSALPLEPVPWEAQRKRLEAAGSRWVEAAAAGWSSLGFERRRDGSPLWEAPHT
jgi:hypothetical protein